MKSPSRFSDRFGADSARGSFLSGIHVLKCLAQGGSSLGVTQVAERALLPKATAHRLLQTLRRLGYVEQDVVTKRYLISPEIFGFLHHLSSHFSPSQKTAPILRETAARLGVTVQLSMLAGDAAYIVAAAGPRGDTQVLGSHTPALSTAGGRALVAQFPEKDWPRFLGDMPSSSIDGLGLIRDSGIARGDTMEGTRSVAAAVVASNGARLAVTILYPEEEACSHDSHTSDADVRRLAGEVAEAVGLSLPLSRPSRIDS